MSLQIKYFKLVPLLQCPILNCFLFILCESSQFIKVGMFEYLMKKKWDLWVFVYWCILISVWLTILWSFLFIYLRELKDYYLVLIYLYIHTYIHGVSKCLPCYQRNFKPHTLALCLNYSKEQLQRSKWIKYANQREQLKCETKWSSVAKSWIDYKCVKTSPDSGIDFPVQCVPADFTDSFGELDSGSFSSQVLQADVLLLWWLVNVLNISDN